LLLYTKERKNAIPLFVGKLKKTEKKTVGIFMKKPIDMVEKL
jgi:hypothetical protein